MTMKCTVGEFARAADVPTSTVRDDERAGILSPSVQVNGKDIDPDVLDRTAFALSCRMYESGGVSPRELLEKALREALER